MHSWPGHTLIFRWEVIFSTAYPWFINGWDWDGIIHNSN